VARTVLEKAYISNAEALKVVEEKASKYLEGASIVLRRTLDYLLQVSKCSEGAEKARKELEKLGLSSESSAVLVNVLPKDVSEARSLLMPADRHVGSDVLEKALEVLSTYCS